MEAFWREGVIWITSDTYEGPADLMNFFLERGKLPADHVTVQPLLDALIPLLEQLPLEEQMEVLLFLAHLLWLKTQALLPILPAEDSSSQAESLPATTPSWLSPAFLRVWEEAIQQAQYRLARPLPESIPSIPFLKPISQMDLLKAYLAIQAAYERRQRRYQVQLPPLSLEIVAQDLEAYFADTPQTTLSALFASFPRTALYWVMGFFVILSWVQEERLHYEPLNLWEGRLTWLPHSS